MSGGAEQSIFGVDLARGPDHTVYWCGKCGITTYPCNCLKDHWARERRAKAWADLKRAVSAGEKS